MASKSIVFVWFVMILFSVCSVESLEKNEINEANQTKETTQEDMDIIRAYLKKINKPGIKTIESPDGDIIDCVLSDQQLAFDHPLLKGQKPLDPPELPIGYNSSDETNKVYQLWSMSGESCPDGTVPVKRTTEEEILQFGNIPGFGRKFVSGGHEYAVAYVNGNKIYGAKADINIWQPKVRGPNEFSLSQIWVLAGAGEDINSVEAGWQVYPKENRGNEQSRLFIYWTGDGYKNTGCYNLKCPGFVQISKKVIPGGAIIPLSTYGGQQQHATFLIYKDVKTGNWWLKYDNTIVGYWPSVLFTHLKNFATQIQYGGEVVNSEATGEHTSTEMGSGHFPQEGFGKAAFFRNVQVINEAHNLEKPHNIELSVDHPNCYNIKKEDSKQFGLQFYYGGPGKNPNCIT